MCGLFCAVGEEVQNIDHKRVRMALKTRGSDNFGHASFPNVEALHSCLAVSDEISCHQPHYDEGTNSLLLFNGQIYNFEELRAKFLTPINKN